MTGVISPKQPYVFSSNKGSETSSTELGVKGSIGTNLRRIFHHFPSGGLVVGGNAFQVERS